MNATVQILHSDLDKSVINNDCDLYLFLSKKGYKIYIKTQIIKMDAMMISMLIPRKSENGNC